MSGLTPTPLEALIGAISPPGIPAATRARAAMDAKTKPRGSLGRIEDVAVQVASVRDGEPLGRPLVLVAAADHGVAVEGVSAYPQEVTAQMVANFASGGAAVSVLARASGADLHVVDVGVVQPVEVAGVVSRRIGPGTANAAEGPAMSRSDAEESLLAGARFAVEHGVGAAGVIVLGEMGIGNSTSAAAVVAALSGASATAVCGPGTGLDQAGVAHKAQVVERMLAVNGPHRDDPLGVLAAVGGFEIGFLAGAALGAASGRALVVLDGFISGAAGLVALRLAPALAGFLVAAHRSPEPGHRIVLEQLGLEPLLDLGLRLGEGSGAALALPLLRASVALLDEMATFAEASVTDTGR